LRANARDQALEFRALDNASFNFGRQIRQFSLRKVQVTSHAKKGLIEKIGRWREQEFARRQRQLCNLGTPIALQVEGRGASRRVITAMAFGLDNQGSSLAVEVGREAGPGDTAADD
jgi:hypothetical protein